MKLQQQAAQMIAFARQNFYTEGQPLAPYRRELPRGLVLLYRIEAGQHRLALTRREVPPSEFEVDICRRAFDVPAWVERQDQHKGAYHHVSLVWGESAPEPPLVTIAYPSAAEWLAVPHSRWRREGDKIVVAYQDYDELYWSVECSRLLKEVLAQRANPRPPAQMQLFEQRGENYYAGG